MNCCFTFLTTLSISILSLAIPSSASAARYSLTTLASFDGENGKTPNGSLILDSNGNLYGSTKFGGKPDGNGNGYGTVFKIEAGTGQIITLAKFDPNYGVNPYGGVIADTVGNLYGTTHQYGNVGLGFGFGTVYKIEAGTGTLSTLATFRNSLEAATPGATVLSGIDGNLYGTTLDGGSRDSGATFKVDLATNTLTVLAKFNGENGRDPEGSLIVDTQGLFYGTTSKGGKDNLGTVFELNAVTHELTTLYSFGGADGKFPVADLVTDGNGNLYGTTSSGGDNNLGSVFRLNLDTHSLTTLHSFNGRDGYGPTGGLIFDSEGNLLGTTPSGGTGYGTVFKLNIQTNTLTTLASFNWTNGAQPSGKLTLDESGNLYGTTRAGGSIDYGYGTVFKLSVVPETSSLLLAGFGLIAFVIPCIKRVREAK